MANTELVEILVLAMVAGVIIFRLYSVLGRRTGNEKPTQDRIQLSQPAAKVSSGDGLTALPPPSRSPEIAPDANTRGLLDIKSADRSFDPDHFLAGSRHAYELIVTAFAANDRDALKPLLSDEVYTAFDCAIRDREDRKEKISFTFVGFKDCNIANALLKGKTADITVAFSAQFISATIGETGNLVEGDPKSVRDVKDIWSFERNIKSTDPNWILVATSGGESHS